MSIRSLFEFLPRVILVQVLVCIPAMAQDIDAGQGRAIEGFYDYPDMQELMQYRALKNNVRAQQELRATLAEYDRVVQSSRSDEEKLKALRRPAMRKVLLYRNLNISKDIMGIPSGKIDGYVNAWISYWRQVDRANVANLLSKPAPGQPPVLTHGFSPMVKSLLNLGVDSAAFDRAISAHPDFPGIDPDQHGMFHEDYPGCEEHYHSGKYIGGGYTVDDRGVLLSDSCSPDGKKVQVWECVADIVSPSPTATPSGSPSNGGTTGRTVARSRIVSCACTEILTADKVKTAICH